eukprot:5816829-Karenia_brevis.AAC.1
MALGRVLRCPCRMITALTKMWIMEPKRPGHWTRASLWKDARVLSSGGASSVSCASRLMSVLLAC